MVQTEFQQRLLNKMASFQEKGKFEFTRDGKLSKACNVPKGPSSGIYLAFDHNSGELLYVGESGSRLDASGNLKSRKDGLYGRILNGKRFGSRGETAWRTQMENYNIHILDFNWYIIPSNHPINIPKQIEIEIICLHCELHKTLPRWNSKL